MKKILLMMCAAILLSGCGKSDERNHPLFQKGKRAQSVGNGEEAAEFFHKFLARRPGSVYVHLQLATVYDELLDEPLTAAYHYRQYLRLVPDAPDAEEVRSWLKICEKRCYENLKKEFSESPAATADELPATPAVAPAAGSGTTATTETASTPAAPADSADTAASAAAEKELKELKLLLEQYRSRHQLMQRELEKFRQTTAPANTAAPDTTANAGATDTAAARTYRVQPGDTPGGIARKVYGKSSLYTVILRANPDLDARKLKPGMLIKVPQLPDQNKTQTQ